MVDASGTDYKKAYTLQFVGKGVGLETPSSVIASRRSAMSRTLIIIGLAITAAGLLWP